jgi:hypothetical protein
MHDFLANPGSPGPFGALMDEYARAAQEFCLVAESLADKRFAEERASEDPDCVSARAICGHACGAAWGYANCLRHAQGIEMTSPPVAPADRIRIAPDVRAPLVDALRYTEESIAALRVLSDAAVEALEWRVSWGPLYNPESMLEHGIVHLLRHRRQLERW